MRRRSRVAVWAGAALMGVGLPAVAATVSRPEDMTFSGKLIATGGVTQVEGAAGGGLTPWAVIGGGETREEVGATAFFTAVRTHDYGMNAYGALIGLWDRVELSVAQNRLDIQAIGGALGLGDGYAFTDTVAGVKVRVAGDAVYGQDSWMPQVALGAQYKSNNRGGLVKALGARSDTGLDLYASATKVLLAQSLLLSGTVRLTKANQTGLLGFGGADDDYHAELEGSAALLLDRALVAGVEYRMKPDTLARATPGLAPEDDWYDAFVAWLPSRNLAFTLAYVNLGRVVTPTRQNAVYLSLQAGF
ncbi:DUF3034 family protein [Nitrospirillum sp. BR 11163]|uniref:DUF3034 family protein n=1 Tax=Nitrospirillum sp. BR 11163 TaxID=3104323 RepID=UPI002AFFC7CC|nr:DUF3034 family protein [Nitrospirillum sp. BR 11163]MEA1675570.1 DUF3034 family protein [Nitrospirillum sp. BR 11163]